MYLKHPTRGFSLVETLIAVAIMGLLVLAVASLLSTMLASEKRNRAVAEVEAQANYVLYEITESIRNSNTVAVPIAGATGSLLRVASNVTAENPTYVALTNGTIEMKKGTAATTTLTSTTVTVTGLTFQNLTASTTKGSVRVGITMSYKNSSIRPELNFANTFYTTVTLR